MDDATKQSTSHPLLDAAQHRAEAEDKRISVVFGAGWCPDCDALDRALAHPRVAPIVEPNFVIVKIDVGQRDRHLDLMARFGMEVGRGIPAIAILEADGSLVDAQTEGQWGSARSLPVLSFAEYFHRWAPPRSGRQ